MHQHLVQREFGEGLQGVQNHDRPVRKTNDNGLDTCDGKMYVDEDTKKEGDIKPGAEDEYTAITSDICSEGSAAILIWRLSTNTI